MAKNKINLRNGTFKHIESELQDYRETQKELKRLKELIIDSSHHPSNELEIKDPTGEKATSILLNRRITHIENILEAIEIVYDSLPEHKQNLVYWLYWNRPQTLNWDGIALKCEISKRQAQRWRREIVESIAYKLGWR